MLRRGILFRGGLLMVGFCVLAVAALAENLTGTWMGLIPGVERDIEFKIIQHGATLSGKLYRDGASSPIIDGKVDERGEVEFVVETREQAGNQINIVVYRFEGVVCEGGIDLTRELSAARDAVSGAVVPVRRWNDTPEQDRRRRFQSFTLVRLF